MNRKRLKYLRRLPPLPCYRSHTTAARFFPIRLFVAMGLAAVVLPGCVRRTMTIHTDPPHALVFLNDQEVGRSSVTTEFLWYGDYDVIVRKEGYKTLKTHWRIEPPWYQVIPFDFVAEVLWPGRLHDQHEQSFTLEPAKSPTQDELISRAHETRRQADETRK